MVQGGEPFGWAQGGPFGEACPEPCHEPVEWVSRDSGQAHYKSGRGRLFVFDMDLDHFYELRRDLNDAVFFRMGLSVLQHFFFRFPPDNVVTPAGWVHLAAVNHFSHDRSSSQKVPR